VKHLRKLLAITISVRPALIILALWATSFCALGQTIKSKDVQAPPPEVSGKRTSADESFELNIDERRFSRVNFEASTSVGTEGDTALNLQIGVAVAAGRIEVLLRNVQGRVRFRGSLDRILEMMNNRRMAAPEPSPR
jgi:hypothetical protein